MKIGSQVWMPRYRILIDNEMLPTQSLGGNHYMGWSPSVFQVVSHEAGVFCLTNDGHVFFASRGDVFETKKVCDVECKLRNERNQRP